MSDDEVEETLHPTAPILDARIVGDELRIDGPATLSAQIHADPFRLASLGASPDASGDAAIWAPAPEGGVLALKLTHRPTDSDAGFEVAGVRFAAADVAAKGPAIAAALPAILASLGQGGGVLDVDAGPGRGEVWDAARRAADAAWAALDDGGPCEGAPMAAADPDAFARALAALLDAVPPSARPHVSAAYGLAGPCEGLVFSATAESMSEAAARLSPSDAPPFAAPDDPRDAPSALAAWRADWARAAGTGLPPALSEMDDFLRRARHDPPQAATEPRVRAAALARALEILSAGPLAPKEDRLSPARALGVAAVEVGEGADDAWRAVAVRARSRRFWAAATIRRGEWDADEADGDRLIQDLSELERLAEAWAACRAALRENAPTPFDVEVVGERIARHAAELRNMLYIDPTGLVRDDGAAPALWTQDPMAARLRLAQLEERAKRRLVAELSAVADLAERMGRGPGWTAAADALCAAMGVDRRPQQDAFVAQVVLIGCEAALSAGSWRGAQFWSGGLAAAMRQALAQDKLAELASVQDRILDAAGPARGGLTRLIELVEAEVVAQGRRAPPRGGAPEAPARRGAADVASPSRAGGELIDLSALRQDAPRPASARRAPVDLGATPERQLAHDVAQTWRRQFKEVMRSRADGARRENISLSPPLDVDGRPIATLAQAAQTLHDLVVDDPHGAQAALGDDLFWILRQLASLDDAAAVDVAPAPAAVRRGFETLAKLADDADLSDAGPEDGADLFFLFAGSKLSKEPNPAHDGHNAFYAPLFDTLSYAGPTASRPDRSANFLADMIWRGAPRKLAPKAEALDAEGWVARIQRAAGLLAMATPRRRAAPDAPKRLWEPALLDDRADQAVEGDEVRADRNFGQRVRRFETPNDVLDALIPALQTEPDVLRACRGLARVVDANQYAREKSLPNVMQISRALSRRR